MSGSLIVGGAVFITGIIYWYVGRSERKDAEEKLNQAQKESTQVAVQKFEWEKQIKQKEQELENQKKEKLEIEDSIKQKLEIIKSINEALDKNHIQGRQWLASLIRMAFESKDIAVEEYLKYRKKSPAPTAASTLRDLRLEMRELREKNILLQSQIDTYKEYFPFIDELEEEILNDEEDYRNLSKEEIEQVDPVRKYVSNEEYKNLSVVDRNQRALDVFLSNMSKLNVGKMYERQLGWWYENQGFDVQYDGLIKNLEDRGRDLLVTDRKKKILYVVQAKCWSQTKTIHEKHIFQLFGTSYELKKHNLGLIVKPVFTTTTKLSPFAQEVARLLGIEVRTTPLRKDWPMIKCNVGKDGERIYHLPFDQLYDYTKIDKKGEFWVGTVAEAEEKGFRRAWRWRNN